MSLPKYESYRDSGIDWLGDIPEDWNVALLKRLGSIRYGIGEPPEYQPAGTPLVRATNVNRGMISEEGMVYVDPSDIPEQRIVWLEEGDIIVVRSGAYTGDSAIIPNGFGQAIAGFDMVLRIHDAVPQFVQYALLSIYLKDFQIELKRMRAAQPHLNAEELGECVFVYPSIQDQTAIAEFLDRETAKIDDLIAEQKKLIALLKEKRQAVISHAVTKGLNPDAPMKDSGIEWLGDVPEHWEVVPLKYLVKVRGGGTPSKSNLEYWNDGDVPWASSKDLKVEELADTIDHITRFAIDDGAADLVEHGSLLVVVRGMILAHTFPVVKTLTPMAINQDLKALRPTENLREDFLCWGLRGGTLECLGRTDQAAHGTKVLRMDWWLAMPFPVPPIQEQIEISRSIVERDHKYKSLIKESQRAIQLLQERRTALISAAVTGKIDVREKSQKTKRNKKGGSQYFRRTVFAAKIIDDLCEEKTFGHVKFQKCLYLIQHHLQLDNLLESYKRMAAGPYDNRLIRSVDSQLKKKQWFEAQKIGKGYKYKRLEKYQEYEPYFKRYFEQQESEIEKLISLLRPLDTQRCEIIATLYAAWNDFLLQNKPIDDSQIVDEVLTNWNESKNTIPRERWMKALDWMRKKKLIPSGFGQPTILPTEGRS